MKASDRKETTPCRNCESCRCRNSLREYEKAIAFAEYFRPSVEYSSTPPAGRNSFVSANKKGGTEKPPTE